VRGVVARAGMVSVEEIDDPRPGPGQVLVAPIACGICGSDVHFVESQAAMPDLVPPIVLGHEFVCEVLDFGPETDRTLPIGSIVTSVPYLETADGPQLIGLSPTVTGGLTERMVLQEKRLLAVPEGAESAHAALAEPLAVGAHAVGAADMQPGDVTLVVGCGPVGLAVIASLKANGHGPVVAADFSPGRRALAERIGADVVVDPRESSPYAKWSEFAGPALPSSPLLERELRPNTVVFECVGVPGILQTVIDSALPHTRIVVVGVCTQPDTFTPMVATVKEVSIRYVFAYRPDEFAHALNWIVDGTVDVGPFITATRGLDAVADAFADLRQPEEHCKILLTPRITG
jgi:2-desacetyl-2-hydroxyethyl bacteriochlorophyllide A dehydrogenase